MPLLPEDIATLSRLPGFVSFDGEELVFNRFDPYVPDSIISSTCRVAPMSARSYSSARGSSEPASSQTSLVGRPRASSSRTGWLRESRSELVTPSACGPVAWRRTYLAIMRTRGPLQEPDPTELETATDEHLTALAGLFGIERRTGSIPTVNIMVPGSISRTEIKATFVTDPEYASRYDRAEVV